MPSKCFMCGAAVTQGILCEKCDKPRRPKVQTAPPKVETKAEAPVPPARPAAAAQSTQPAPARPAAPPQSTAASNTATAPAIEPEPFPKAPVLPFPVESASPAITSLANVLATAAAAAIIIAPDRTVKFITDEAKKLFGVPQSDLGTLRQIETLSGARIGDLSVPASQALQIRGRNILFSLVPIASGATGAVLVFREADPLDAAHASFITFVRETVFSPLRSLRESMLAASRSRHRDPLLDDAASTIDQILSSLEMAPEVGEQEPASRVPKVVDIIHSIANRFGPFAELKNIQLQIDVPELEERFRNHAQLSDALGILMDNSLHYVPPGGQVVVGVRWMEHKGKPLLLFFVMDNGPVVPEALRTTIFEPNFAWNPTGAERTGRSLFKVREFAVGHAGSVWVESKTGKACTFFLRVRPDGAR